MTAGLLGRLIVMLLGAVLLAGCGVGLQETAEPLPSGALRPASPAPSQTATTKAVSVCFVNGSSLERVPEPILSHTAEAVMGALAAGPPADRAGELRSLILDLTGAPVLVVTQITSEGEVVLRHTEDYLQLNPIDQVLLIGQVACSLNEVDLTRIILVDPMGQPAPLPLPDGRVREGAASVEDYRALLPDP